MTIRNTWLTIEEFDFICCHATSDTAQLEYRNKSVVVVRVVIDYQNWTILSKIVLEIATAPEGKTVLIMFGNPKICFCWSAKNAAHNCQYEITSPLTSLRHFFNIGIWIVTTPVLWVGCMTISHNQIGSKLADDVISGWLILSTCIIRFHCRLFHFDRLSARLETLLYELPTAL